MFDAARNQKWNLNIAENAGRPIIIRINAASKNQQLQAQYPYRVGIAIPLKNVQTNGLPTEEENKSLLVVEDSLLHALDETSLGILIAVISTNNMRELMMYCKDASVTNILVQLQEKFPDYEFQSYSQLDPDWSGHLALLQMSNSQ